MKIKEVEFKNHVHFQNWKCQFGDEYTEVWGLNGSGKTTVIDAIFMALNGIKERGTDCIIGDRYQFIGSAAKSVGVKVTLIDTENGNAKITLTRKMTGKSNGTLKISAPKGYPTLDDKWLNDLLSVAFLSHKHFCAKTSQEQAILLGCDTSEYDAKTKELKAEYRDLGRDLKPYEGLEEIEKAEKVDVWKLQEEKNGLEIAENSRLDKIRKANDKLKDKYRDDLEAAKDEAREFNRKQTACAVEISDAVKAFNILKELQYPHLSKLEAWIELLQEPESHKIIDEITIPQPELTDDTADMSKALAVDEKIKAAYETNEKAHAYKEYLKKVEKRDEFRELRKRNKDVQAEVMQKKIEHVAASELPFSGLTIDENGGLLYQGREIREPYFSAGELIKIVASLKTKCGDNLKTIYLDDCNLLDDENRQKVVNYLLGEGFQVIAAFVGRSKKAENVVTLSLIEEKEIEGKPEMA